MTPTPVDILATERLVNVITEDQITEQLRWKLVSKYDGSDVAYLVTCKVCSSVWAGVIVSVAKRTRIGRVLVYGLALSQATSYLRKLTDG